MVKFEHADSFQFLPWLVSLVLGIIGALLVAIAMEYFECSRFATGWMSCLAFNWVYEFFVKRLETR